MAPYYNPVIQPLILLCLLLISASSFSKRHPCLSEQQNALLQFKETLIIETNYDISWQNDTDCCMWYGVTCDCRTGNVINLDISFFEAVGTIDNNSSLFLLQNLQSLNLSYNSLSGSLSPFTQLPKLMHLDLSSNKFSGIIPHEIAHLSQLISLNLGGNILTFTSSILGLLIQNLTQIQDLNLEGVRIDEGFASSLLNLSSTLTTLTLTNCSLRGRFPDHVLHLPNLYTLKVNENLGLTGTLPNLNWSSPLISLDLSSTGFSGNISNSIGNLKNIENLNLYKCHFTNLIPSSICGLSSLQVLNLSGNKLSGLIPQCLGNLTNLLWLDMSLNQLTGPLPRSLNRCTLLEHMNISSNMLSDTSPSWLSCPPNFLKVVDLGKNRFYGPMGRLCTGSVLNILILGHNHFSSYLPDFPSDLILNELDLSNNSFEGPISKLPRVSILLLLSNNKFTGGIPLSICKLGPVVLDLSGNNLTGTIPPCLLNITDTLGNVINLGMNKLEGFIPDNFIEFNQITVLDLRQNQLKGPLPRSMVNCHSLVLLDLSNNNIEDSFPNWLETLPLLEVLALGSNKFNGMVNTLLTDHPFPRVRLFDISNNNLTGPIPIQHIYNQFDAIKNADIIWENFRYMDTYQWFASSYRYFMSIKLTVKGSKIEFSKISSAWTLIDFSNNNFQGEIPEVIGELVALKGLNLSHNNLTGCIPLSIENLTSLEWLDLSSNRFNGVIPSGLAHLTELSSLNVSYNELRGMIPRGQQLDTFGIESFVGNTGLCGLQVNKSCGEHIPDQPKLPVPSTEVDDFNAFNWKIILMGYVSGLVIGISIGYMVLELRRPEWFVTLVEEKLLKNIVNSST